MTDTDPYCVPCPACGSEVGEPCFMLRAPFDSCAWPHKARIKAAKAGGSR